MPDRRLRIGIDAHVLGRPMTGNERVMANLIPALRNASEHELLLYVGRSDAAAAWSSRMNGATRVRSLRIDNFLARLGFSLPIAARADGIDVLLAHYNRPISMPCPVATIVHDVSFARHPDHFSLAERAYLSTTIPWSMRRSAAIVTGSAFSRDEFQAVYGIPPERVTVAPYGVDPVFRRPSVRPAPLEPPYFLSVGSLQPRKNLITLLRAYRRLLDQHPDVGERLVITGREMRIGELYKEAGDLRERGRIVFTGHVDDEALVSLLRGATAFAYPSVYEGFGFPPLEAMSAGAPAVVADIPVMREVAGDGAHRVPATDVGGWATALWRLSSEPRFREELAADGREWAAKFTWEATATAVLGAVEGACMP